MIWDSLPLSWSSLEIKLVFAKGFTLEIPDPLSISLSRVRLTEALLSTLANSKIKYSVFTKSLKVYPSFGEMGNEYTLFGFSSIWASFCKRKHPLSEWLSCSMSTRLSASRLTTKWIWSTLLSFTTRLQIWLRPIRDRPGLRANSTICRSGERRLTKSDSRVWGFSRKRDLRLKMRRTNEGGNWAATRSYI